MLDKDLLDAINQQSANINELKDTLKQFIDVSVQHFEKQDGFNTQFLSKLDEISKKP
jgi:DNA repair ATPase RecN